MNVWGWSITMRQGTCHIATDHWHLIQQWPFDKTIFDHCTAAHISIFLHEPRRMQLYPCASLAFFFNERSSVSELLPCWSIMFALLCHRLDCRSRPLHYQSSISPSRKHWGCYAAGLLARPQGLQGCQAIESAKPGKSKDLSNMAIAWQTNTILTKQLVGTRQKTLHTDVP